MEDLTHKYNSLAISGKRSKRHKSSRRYAQNKRREEFRAEQKRRRENVIDEARSVSVGRVVKEFSNKLMLSEWMTKRPQDLNDFWWLKLCPKGHRNLIVAHENSTKAYSKYGRLERVFKSALPGACGGRNKYKKTILDVIYNSESKSFYILDILMWADYSLVEYDVEFRFFWLQSKLTEFPELQTVTPGNAHAFHYVSHASCDVESLKSNLMKFPYYRNNSPSVDGLLFYHRHTTYISGQTPMVGWLKPYMVPEILSMPVSKHYLNEKPANYLNVKYYIKFIEETKKKQP